MVIVSSTGPNVVQGNVVQATEVNPAMAYEGGGGGGQAPVMATVVQPGQPSVQVVGQPVMGTPVAGVGMPQPVAQVDKDQQAANMAWIGYGIGWLACCCCPPIGIVIWCVMGCMHYCKPAPQRKELPRERQAAGVNMFTGCCCCCVCVIFLIILIAAAGSAKPQDDSPYCKTPCSSIDAALMPDEFVCQTEYDACYENTQGCQGDVCMQVPVCHPRIPEFTLIDKCGASTKGWVCFKYGGPSAPETCIPGACENDSEGISCYKTN